jgi:hypothetical protein
VASAAAWRVRVCRHGALQAQIALWKIRVVRGSAILLARTMGRFDSLRTLAARQSSASPALVPTGLLQQVTRRRMPVLVTVSVGCLSTAHVLAASAHQVCVLDRCAESATTHALMQHT